MVEVRTPFPYLVAFRDNDGSVPIDSTGFNKIGVVTEGKYITFEKRGRVMRSNLTSMASLRQDRKEIALQLDAAHIHAYFYQKGLTVDLFHLGLKWLLSRDAAKFLLPHRLARHDQIDLNTLANRYQQLRSQAKPADLLLTFLPSSKFSRLITYVDRGPWSHVGLVSERLTVIEAVTSGVREVPLDDYMTHPFRLGLFRSDPPFESPGDVIDAARSQIGAAYSYRKALIAGLQKLVGAPRIAPTPNDLAVSAAILPVLRA